MQHIISMPRLSRLAERNRNRGLKVLLTTAAIVAGTLASLAFLASLPF